ncbi:MAG: TIGR02147 family protein [Pseudobdellovibrio sp.]
MQRLIYSFDDYKTYLKATLEQAEASWGAISRMADAAGCQRSYLSRCLNAEIHLTLDHAYSIAQFLKLSESEEDYFMNLVEKDRAATATYRQKIIQKLNKIKQEQEDLERIAKRPRIALGEKEVFYYSSWLATALHIIVSIPKFQNVKSIAEHLQIDSNSVEMCLTQLEEMGLVKKDQKKWTFNSSELHVPKNSPLVHMHHNNWRQKAILDSQKANPESIHYTVVQSLDKKAYDEIKARTLKMISEITKIAGPSPSEELICFTCDFFKV